jgi:UDP-N-acetylglucosamine 2-epimerase (non-hydrolysing)
MKLALAVGTRPEIVKMAPVIRAAQNAGVPHTIIHTGQHYSWELDGVFFEELGLPEPDETLRVGSGTQAMHLSRIIERIEPVLSAGRPDAVVVQGDTNSVLAVALAARSVRIPVVHVEAGLRSNDRAMPEEVNRILVDHIADWCFAPTERSRRILAGEGITADRIAVTGNTVVDEILRQRERAEALRHPERLDLRPGGYALATIHRAENTDDPERLRAIFSGLSLTAHALRMPLLAALHPRTQAALDRASIAVRPPVRMVPAMGYLEFLGLHASAALTLTDSGGLQEEACTLGVPCVTLRDSTERPESVEVGANMLAGWDPDGIAAAAREMADRPRTWPNPFGDGRSGERIIRQLTTGAEVAGAAPGHVVQPDWPARVHRQSTTGSSRRRRGGPAPVRAK